MEETVPFEVSEEISGCDLSVVNEQKFVVPATANVKVRIAKAAIAKNKDKDIDFLKLELRIVDGIMNEAGIAQFVNKPLFTDTRNPAEGIVIKADETVKGRDQKVWWKNKQYQLEYKRFLLALDLPIAPTPTVNDEFLHELIGRELCVDIQHEEETVLDAKTGEYVGLGTYRERLKFFKKAN